MSYPIAFHIAYQVANIPKPKPSYMKYPSIFWNIIPSLVLSLALGCYYRYYHLDSKRSQPRSDGNKLTRRQEQMSNPTHKERIRQTLHTSAGIEEYLNNVANGATASYWLKDAIKALLNRDCLDAAKDVEFLQGWLSARAELILQGK